MTAPSSFFGSGDRRDLAWLALLSVVLFIVPLVFLDLPGGDETRVAGITAEMALDGDWRMPKLNGSPFLEYPPLYYAAGAVCCRVFGITPFAVKLPAALAALAGVLMFYAMMRDLRRPAWESFAGAFMLATGGQYLANSHSCRVDMMLAAFCILAWWGFVRMEFSGRGAAKRLGGAALCAAGIAGGVFTKNLPGLAIPLSGIGCALFFTQIARRRFCFAAWCRLAGAVVFGLLPYALYLWFLHERYGAAECRTLLWENNFGRFSGARRDHRAPWWFYLGRIFEQFQPYLLLFFLGFWFRCRELFRRRSPRSILLLSLAAVPFVMLSAASGKRQVYLLPLAAPAALIAASALPWLRQFCRRSRRGVALLGFCRARRGLLLWAATGCFALISAFAAGYVSHRDSYAPAFAEAERLHRATGGRFVLINPIERLAGAAVFYRHAVTPQLSRWEELLPGDVALTQLRSGRPLPPLPPGFAARRYDDADLLLVAPAGSGVTAARSK